MHASGTRPCVSCRNLKTNGKPSRLGFHARESPKYEHLRTVCREKVRASVHRINESKACAQAIHALCNSMHLPIRMDKESLRRVVHFNASPNQHVLRSLMRVVRV